MKRSKMIKDIKNLIEMNLAQLRDIPDASLLSELILHHQEQSGMLPPRNKKKEKYSAKMGQYPDEYTIPVNEWETE